MTGFQRVVKFFNSKRLNKVFTRAEYLAAFRHSLVKDIPSDPIAARELAESWLRYSESGS